MKSLLLVGLLVALASGKTLIPKPGEYREGDRYAYVPDNEGNLYLADLEEIMNAAPKFDAFKDINLYVYTRKNPTNPDVIKNGNIDELASSHLDVSKPVKIVVHGWISDWDSAINGIITEAFLEALDVNVIFVDWSYGGSTILYPVASARVSSVGQFVASVVDWLVGFGVPINNFHLVGHSLGAHACGYAGRNVKSGRIPYITGMDPASPLWSTVLFYSGIYKNDGNYVEIIHTEVSTLGIWNNIGHADFYPNSGWLQPGCVLISCSHSRAYEFFADSLDHQGFMATRCSTVTQATSGGLCWGSNLHMGSADPKNTNGIYYLKTNKRKPFHKG